MLKLFREVIMMCSYANAKFVETLHVIYFFQLLYLYILLSKLTVTFLWWWAQLTEKLL